MSYLLAGQSSELERLQLQARVWEPAGRTLLAQIPPPQRTRALDIGCGVLGWLRVLSEWTGPDGRVVGTDVEPKMLANAQTFVTTEALGNVDLVHDDVFASELSPASFDLVHARFQLAPLGRVEEQLAAFQRLTKSGGWLVLEDPDIASWRVHPDAPALSRLVVLIEQGFVAAGGDFNAGRKLPDYLRSLGGEPRVAAHVVALADGHPYLRLPLQFATSLRPRLESLVGANELERLMREAEVELTRPETWGTTFTLIQAYARLP